MARLIVACPSCKARFDVSAYKPGSKIRCGSCMKVLRIPDRPAAGNSGKRPAKAPQAAGKNRKPTPKPPVASKAKKGAPPTPVAAPEKTPPTPTPPAPPPKKSAEPARPAAKPAAKAQVSAPESLIGHRINGDFEIIKLIGRGGYGSVYEATDLTLQRRVAVKLMLKEKTKNQEFVAKFLREARTAAQLSHPNIVKIHLVGFDKQLEQHFLAMEYVEGMTLSDIMGAEGAFPTDRAVEVIVQAAKGLAEAHRKNIIHRDIKPGNIMITPKGVVKITDFGLAKIYDPDAKASTIIGTPYFMPPEQFEGKVKDGRTDIYSLGVTFYYILTLKRPFDGTSPTQVLLNILQTEPAHPSEHGVDVPEPVYAVVQKMIARKLEERYTTCEEVLRDLRLYEEAENSEEKVFCPSCGFGNPLSAEKCVECRTSLLEPCPGCGTPDFVGAKFCGNCGTNLGKAKEAAALVAEAESHMAAGRIEKALERYRSAKETSPENSRVIEGIRTAEQALTERGEVIDRVKQLSDEGEVLAALEMAEEAAERYPSYEPLEDVLPSLRDAAKDARVAAALKGAREQMAAGEFYEAVSSARSVLEVDSGHEEAATLLAQAEKTLDEHAGAREAATRLEAERRLAEALAEWKKALGALPSDEAASQAVSRIEGILEQTEKLRARAQAALAERDLVKARASLTDAAELYSEESETLELLRTLSENERHFQSRFEEAVAGLLDGDPAGAREALAELAEEFPKEVAPAKVLSAADALETATKTFAEQAEALLADGRLEGATLLEKVAGQLCPKSGDSERIGAAIEGEIESRDRVVAEAEKLLEGRQYPEAEQALGALGGVASRHPRVAELARRAMDARRQRSEEAWDRKQEVLAASIRTARELFDAGRVQAALAACQKALRMDRTSRDARALKKEIDAAMNAPKNPEGGMETGFLDLTEGKASS